MTLDSNGRPHLVCSSGVALRYAHFDGANWRFSTVFDGFYATEPDIAVGADGVVHIVYYNSNARTLHYARG